MTKGWCVRCSEIWPDAGDTCATCGAAVEEQRPCRSCGCHLQAAMRFCPECGAGSERRTMCAACQKPLGKGMKFCPSCGGSAKEVTNTPRPSGLLGSRIEAEAALPVTPLPLPLAAARGPPLAVSVSISSHSESREVMPAGPASPRAEAAATPEPTDAASAAIDLVCAQTGISFIRGKRLVDLGFDVARLKTTTLGELTRVPGMDEWSAHQVLEGFGAPGHPLPDSVDRFDKTVAEVNGLRNRFLKVNVEAGAADALMARAAGLRSEGKVEWAVQVILEARSHLLLQISAHVAHTRESIQARTAQPDLAADTKVKLKRLYFYLDTAIAFRDYPRAIGLCAVAQMLGAT